MKGFIRATRTVICADTSRHNKPLYVAQLRGHGGKDWGYTPDRYKALNMTPRMAAIFVNECPKRTAWPV